MHQKIPASNGAEMVDAGEPFLRGLISPSSRAEEISIAKDCSIDPVGGCGVICGNDVELAGREEWALGAVVRDSRDERGNRIRGNGEIDWSQGGFVDVHHPGGQGAQGVCAGGVDIEAAGNRVDHRGAITRACGKDIQELRSSQSVIGEARVLDPADSQCVASAIGDP